MLTTKELVCRVIDGDVEIGDVFNSQAGEVYINSQGVLVWLDDDSTFEVCLDKTLTWVKVENMKPIF